MAHAAAERKFWTRGSRYHSKIGAHTRLGADVCDQGAGDIDKEKSEKKEVAQLDQQTDQLAEQPIPVWGGVVGDVTGDVSSGTDDAGGDGGIDASTREDILKEAGAENTVGDEADADGSIVEKLESSDVETPSRDNMMGHRQIAKHAAATQTPMERKFATSGSLYRVQTTVNASPHRGACSKGAGDARDNVTEKKDVRKLNEQTATVTVSEDGVDEPECADEKTTSRGERVERRRVSERAATTLAMSHVMDAEDWQKTRSEHRDRLRVIHERMCTFPFVELTAKALCQVAVCGAHLCHDTTEEHAKVQEHFMHRAELMVKFIPVTAWFLYVVHTHTHTHTHLWLRRGRAPGSFFL